MKLICMHCKRTLKILHGDELSAVLYRDDGVYIFCSMDCKDKYNYPLVPQKDVDNLRQSLI